MSRTAQGILLAIVIPLAILGILAAAQAGFQGTPCALTFPKWVGCALAAHENLSGGLIGAGGALFAGWLAWSAVRDQIALEQERDRASERLQIGTLRDAAVREIAALTAYRDVMDTAIAATHEIIEEMKGRAGAHSSAFRYAMETGALNPPLGAAPAGSIGIIAQSNLQRWRTLAQSVEERVVRERQLPDRSTDERKHLQAELLELDKTCQGAADDVTRTRALLEAAVLDQEHAIANLDARAAALRPPLAR